MAQKKTNTNILIHIPIEGNELLEKALTSINNNIEIVTLWKIINVNAIKRLGIADHGPIHSQIVSNIAVKFTRMLVNKGIKMSVTENFDLPDKYAQLIVLLASLFHDLGLSVNRGEHEEFGLFLANNLMH